MKKWVIGFVVCLCFIPISYVIDLPRLKPYKESTKDKTRRSMKNVLPKHFKKSSKGHIDTTYFFISNLPKQADLESQTSLNFQVEGKSFDKNGMLHTVIDDFISTSGRRLLGANGNEELGYKSFRFYPDKKWGPEKEKLLKWKRQSLIQFYTPRKDSHKEGPLAFRYGQLADGREVSYTTSSKAQALMSFSFQKEPWQVIPAKWDLIKVTYIESRSKKAPWEGVIVHRRPYSVRVTFQNNSEKIWPKGTPLIGHVKQVESRVIEGLTLPIYLRRDVLPGEQYTHKTWLHYLAKRSSHGKYFGNVLGPNNNILFKKVDTRELEQEIVQMKELFNGLDNNSIVLVSHAHTDEGRKRVVDEMAQLLGIGLIEYNSDLHGALPFYDLSAMAPKNVVWVMLWPTEDEGQIDRNNYLYREMKKTLNKYKIKSIILGQSDANRLDLQTFDELSKTSPFTYQNKGLKITQDWPGQLNLPDTWFEFGHGQGLRSLITTYLISLPLNSQWEHYKLFMDKIQNNSLLEEAFFTAMTYHFHREMYYWGKNSGGRSQHSSLVFLDQLRNIRLDLSDQSNILVPKMLIRVLAEIRYSIRFGVKWHEFLFESKFSEMANWGLNQVDSFVKNNWSFDRDLRSEVGEAVYKLVRAKMDRSHKVIREENPFISYDEKIGLFGGQEEFPHWRRAYFFALQNSSNPQYYFTKNFSDGMDFLTLNGWPFSFRRPASAIPLLQDR